VTTDNSTKTFSPHAFCIILTLNPLPFKI